MYTISEEIRLKILALCDKADEVLQNGDWPTDDGRFVETATSCTCPLNELLIEIREGVGGA